MPPHPAALDERTLTEQCEYRTGRASGPGGQHRNKVETAVVWLHKPTGVAGEATERRSQPQNRAVALFRLRLNLALAIRTAPAELPSPLWQSRCRGGRIVVSAEHDDFPVLLSEAMDHLAAIAWDPRAAAHSLGTTSSQFIKFLKKCPAAFAAVNRARAADGKHPLK